MMLTFIPYRMLPLTMYATSLMGVVCETEHHTIDIINFTNNIWKRSILTTHKKYYVTNNFYEKILALLYKIGYYLT